MKLTKGQKKEKSKELSDEFKNSSGVFFTTYQGLKFTDISQIREKLSNAQCSFNVVKNNIVFHAVKNAGIKETEDKSIFQGPTAMALMQQSDIVAVAKELAKFAKEFPVLKMKACFADNKWYSSEECEALSKLLTKSDTLSHLANCLYTCKSKIASVLQAPMRDLAFVLKALESKRN
jgi:large subunit ribosomal protein L10